VITSTTVLGGLYLILYEAAYMYFARFGMTPEQAGLSPEALAGGALVVGIVFAGVLIPGRSWR
jgi:hypothetical protein